MSGQHRSTGAGAVVWITGLPSAGKSTFATASAELLRARGAAPCVLDGDTVRAALVPSPGYTERQRHEFYLTLGNLALLLAAQGLLVLVPATAAKLEYRTRLRALAPRCAEVFVDVPLEECARRDSKGLYAAAAQGRVQTLPGVDSIYEAPTEPEIHARGGQDLQAQAQLLEWLLGSAEP